MSTGRVTKAQLQEELDNLHIEIAQKEMVFKQELNKLRLELFQKEAILQKAYSNKESALKKAFENKEAKLKKQLEDNKAELNKLQKLDIQLENAEKIASRILNQRGLMWHELASVTAAIKSVRAGIKK